MFSNVLLLLLQAECLLQLDFVPPFCAKQGGEQVYAKYAPYQFLAYWHELWREYESLVGPFEDVAPERYPLLTGANSSIICRLYIIF